MSHKTKETIASKLEALWHPMCGMVYIIVCIMDFIIFPSYYEWKNSQMSADKVVMLATEFKDSAAQIAALNTLHSQGEWQPITLQQNGLFHMAFGAILGVGIWSRGRVQGNQALTDISNQMQTLATQMSADPTQGQQQVSVVVQQPPQSQPKAPPIAPLAPAPAANTSVTKVSIPTVRVKTS